MEQKQNTILIPIGVVFAIISGITGIVLYFSKVEASTNNNQEQIKSVDSRVDELEKANKEMIDRTARIETKLDFIGKKFDPKNELFNKR